MTPLPLTDRLQKVLVMARDEASRRHHDSIGTEHAMLALTAEGQGVGAATLLQLGLKFASLRADIEQRLRRTKQALPSVPVGHTQSAIRIVELAAREATDLKHTFVGTEHLLLAVVRDEEGMGSGVLRDAGVTLDAARRTVRLLEGEDAAPAPGAA